MPGKNWEIFKFDNSSTIAPRWSKTREYADIGPMSCEFACYLHHKQLPSYANDKSRKSGLFSPLTDSEIREFIRAAKDSDGAGVYAIFRHTSDDRRVRHFLPLPTNWRKQGQPLAERLFRKFAGESDRAAWGFTVVGFSKATDYDTLGQLLGKDGAPLLKRGWSAKGTIFTPEGSERKPNGEEHDKLRQGMTLWNNTRLFSAVSKAGLEVLDATGAPLKDRKAHLYKQANDVAIIYSPESGYKHRPLGFNRSSKGEWRHDVFAAIEPFLSEADKRVRTRGWMEFDLPPEGWEKLAAVLGLNGNTAEEEFRRLPSPIRAHFSPERDTPTVATRVACTSEVRQDHGSVINHLEELLRLGGNDTGNDNRRDLVLVQDGRITFLFEAKSSASTQSIYTAIGQLMYYGSLQPSPPLRVAVLPESVNQEARQVLMDLGIRLVTFRLEKGKPKFDGLEDVLKGVDASGTEGTDSP